MTHNQQGSGPGVEQVLECRERLDIEVVGGLVEHEHIGLLHEQSHELEPAALTT